MIRYVFFLILSASSFLRAQDPSEPIAPPVAEVVAVPDDGVRVSVLGYHDFSATAPETAMRIRTAKFRKQMETIRQLGLTVITLDDFCAWKKGEKAIPPKSILITLDDGWKSVYTEAYPILKEFGYPFTIYLYKEYVDGGSRALTTEMIREMLAHGASLGSHSVTHPFPITLKSFRKKGADPYDAYLRLEMGESKRFLDAKFASKITTYAYPGGFFTEEMFKIAKEFGYLHLFTVLPGKVRRGLPDITLPRYIILGNYDPIFEMATSFRESQGGAPPPGSSPAQATAYPVLPPPGTIINSRLPEIVADLSTLENFNPATLVMKVSGFGEVPAIFHPETGKYSWLVNRRLRQPSCQVSITWKDTSGKPAAVPLRWTFQVDLASAYLPESE